jgi:hypothetical protein
LLGVLSEGARFSWAKSIGGSLLCWAKSIGKSDLISVSIRPKIRQLVGFGKSCHYNFFVKPTTNF